MFVERIFLVVLVLAVLLFYRLRIQEERLRVLMAFVAGLFERVVKHGEAINGISRDSTRQLFKDSSEYQAVIYSIEERVNFLCERKASLS